MEGKKKRVVESYFDSDDGIAWGPVSLREIQWDLTKKKPSKINSRHSTIGLKTSDYKVSKCAPKMDNSQYFTAEETVNENYLEGAMATEKSLLDDMHVKLVDNTVILSSDDEEVIVLSDDDYDVEKPIKTERVTNAGADAIEHLFKTNVSLYESTAEADKSVVSCNTSYLTAQSTRNMSFTTGEKTYCTAQSSENKSFQDSENTSDWETEEASSEASLSKWHKKCNQETNSSLSDFVSDERMHFPTHSNAEFYKSLKDKNEQILSGNCSIDKIYYASLPDKNKPISLQSSGHSSDWETEESYNASLLKSNKRFGLEPAYISIGSSISDDKLLKPTNDPKNYFTAQFSSDKDTEDYLSDGSNCNFEHVDVKEVTANTNCYRFEGLDYDPELGTACLPDSIPDDMDRKSSPIEVPQINLEQFDNSNEFSMSDGFNDTLEEMERALKYGLDYEMPDEEDSSNASNHSPLKYSVPSPSPSKPSDQLASVPTPSKYNFPAASPSPKNLYKIGPTQDTFKIPTLPVKQKKTPTLKKTFDPFRNVMSPVKLYIENSPRMCLKQTIPDRKMTNALSKLPVPVPSVEKVINKENIPEFPMVRYKPAGKQITSSAKKINLPPSIRKLLHQPGVVKHQTRIGQYKNNTMVGMKLMDNEGDLTSIDDSVVNVDVSIVTSNTGFIR